MPVHKKVYVPKLVTNYHPIDLASIIVKLMESIINDNINHITSNNLVSPYQLPDRLCTAWPL